MSAELKSLRLIDWDFPSRSSQVLMHDVCWYPARFVPAVPAHLINALSKPKDLVCDPFCGSGTTLVEALLLGRSAWGLDSNPFAIQIAETKCQIATNPQVLQSPEVHAILDELQALMEESGTGDVEVAGRGRGGGRSARSRLKAWRQQDLFQRGPSNARRRSAASAAAAGFGDVWVNHAENQKWFHAATLSQLTTLLSLIKTAHRADLREILETLFIATLIPASGHKAKKPYGYFADNVVPKECLFKNAYKLFHDRLSRLVRRCGRIEVEPDRWRAPTYSLARGDASKRTDWKEFVCDCIVTSPPYPGAVDYSTAFRLASYWFPHLGRMEEIRSNEIGARWNRRRKGAREEYFAKMHEVFTNMVSHLKDGGTLAIVLPKGRSQTPTIQRLLRDLAEFGELREVARLERSILKRHFVRQGGGIKREIVVVFRTTKK